MKDPIVQAGALVLRQKAAPVAHKDFGSRALKALVRTMKAALAKEQYGVAIAAPQVGAPVRVFVVAGRAFAEKESPEERGDPPAHPPHSSAAHRRSRPGRLSLPPDMVFINPTLMRVSRKMREMSEGCLSVRGKYGTVLRHEKASIKAFDEEGKPFIYHASGLLAHIFQHECDHLEGVLYIDKAVKLTNDDERETLRTDYPA